MGWEFFVPVGTRKQAGELRATCCLRTNIKIFF
jgi:hypothetical protein